MTIDNKVSECKPPLEVTEEMKGRWSRGAREWIERLNSECLKKYGLTLREHTKKYDLPPGFDPDDEHIYEFRISQ